MPWLLSKTKLLSEVPEGVPSVGHTFPPTLPSGETEPLRASDQEWPVAVTGNRVTIMTILTITGKVTFAKSLRFMYLTKLPRQL